VRCLSTAGCRGGGDVRVDIVPLGSATSLFQHERAIRLGFDQYHS